MSGRSPGSRSSWYHIVPLNRRRHYDMAGGNGVSRTTVRRRGPAPALDQHEHEHPPRRPHQARDQRLQENNLREA
ncbi:hypothetical protein [Streptomyces sp. DG1A-41]|uniref:hypothetical protein n=1 Tax=Streptomyces sp. DG1A-41 TaxID=3125779 RepID=UPI0030D51E40